MTDIKNKIIVFFMKSLFKKGGRNFTKLTENDRIEFKKSLQVSSEIISKTYIKTIAGLANNKGGYIIFGIDPTENEIVGIKDEYKDLDNRFLSGTIKDWLDGNFEYEFFTANLDNLIVGFLFVKSAKLKPVIIKTNFNYEGEKAVAGEIYFRYPGMTTRILAADLRAIMQEEVKKGIQSVLSKIDQLIHIGPEHSAILDKQTGIIQSDNSNINLMLSEDILNELNLIDEGKIVKKDGAPAYVIKGEIYKGKVDTKIVEKKIAVGIHESDIIKCFFALRCSNPKDFIKEILCISTLYHPIYFFIHKANMSVKDAISFISKIENPEVKPSTKSFVLDMLKNNTRSKPLGAVIKGIVSKEIKNEKDLAQQLVGIAVKYDLKGKREKSIIRSITFTTINSQHKIFDIFKQTYLKEVIEAFTHIDDHSIKEHRQFYLTELNDLYNYLKADSYIEKSSFRKVVSIFDNVLYKDLC